MNVTEKIQRFGDLLITFTNEFKWVYDDKDSGSYMNGGFWQPIPPAGFSILGTYATTYVTDSHDISGGEHWAICVKDVSGKKLLEKPSFGDNPIWADHGSGGKHAGSCWRPIAPPGYVALGDIMVAGYDKPDRDKLEFVCVRDTLTVPAKAGKQIWTDRGSGVPNYSVDIYSIVPDLELPVGNDQKHNIFANTFVANKNYGKPDPGSQASMNILNLPFPSITKDPTKLPKLDSVLIPSEISGELEDRILTVPFTAIKDSKKSVAWQVANSPFYTIKRKMYFQLELHKYNNSDEPQPLKKTVTTGISTSKTETFSMSTGVSMGFETGISLFGSGTTVTGSFSFEMGFESSSTVESFKEVTIERELTTPPHKAAALWEVGYSISVYRADDTIVGNPITFDVDSFFVDQFPD